MESLSLLKKKFTPPETPGSYFISLEGIEGAGKSSQISHIKNYLQDKGYDVVILREPGGTNFGEKLREAILNSSSTLHPLAECHLFLASRAQLLFEKILPSLLRPNTVVVVDRYVDSTLAYQGVARKLGIPLILSLHQFNPLNLLPHRTYFLDIDLKTSFERQKNRGSQKDYFESEEIHFYQNLIDGYRQAASLFPERIFTLNANQSIDEVKTLILSDLDKILK
jgi:dTMP kinase